ncbi:MAG: ABC transporter permease [Chloroflexota bacterium]
MTISDSKSLDETPYIPIRTRLQPSHGWVSLRLGELWKYRELLFFLTWRDISVRYKQTILGAAWAIIQPFFTMVVFSIFFGQLAKVPSDGIPYPLFAYAALVPWTFFANGLQNSSDSLVGSANLITKVYFPRLIIPAAAVGAGIVDFILAFVVLLALMLFYGRIPTINIIWLPAFILLALATALAVGLWLSALNVYFRDVRYVIPFLIQFWLFATPIAYSSSLIQNNVLRTLYGINPMVGVVEGFRWALLGTTNIQILNPFDLLTNSGFHAAVQQTSSAPGPIILVSTLVVFLLLISGALYFRRMETTFADVI